MKTLKPIPDGLPFLLWLETQREETVMDNAVPLDIPGVHKAYSKGGLETATLLCEAVIRQIVAFDSDDSDAPKTWALLLQRLWEIGLQNPNTKKQAKGIIASREGYLNGEM